MATADLISEVLSVPDSFMASGSVRDAMPVVRFTSDGAVVTASDLDSLRTRTEPSMIGLEHANVLDESLRCSRETKDVQLEPWPALDAILAQIATQLNLNWTLSARVHKLIVYEAGSFFREHRDAEHVPGHMMSLVVDLGSSARGGHVVFLHPLRGSAERPHYSNRFPATQSREWASSTGAWAAWFSSTMHAVSKVESGYRVVLTLDVVATPPPTAALFPAAPKLEGGVAPFAELVWQQIADLLPLADLSRLSRTCRGLHGMVGGSARLLAGELRRGVSAAELLNNGSTSVGVACRHDYLFVTAEQTNEVPLWQLKGRDRVIAEAMRLCGWRVRVRRAFMLEEFLHDFDGGPTTLRRVRIGCLTLPGHARRVLLQLEFPPYDIENVSDDALELEARFRREVEHFDKLVPDDEVWFRVRATDTDNDGDAGLIVVPFVGVKWLETLASCAAVSVSKLAEKRGLWGNESQFGLRSFCACALIGEVVGATDDIKLTYAADLRR